jgi:uncharacterized membrane protein YobD (UPF0266 family)
MEDISMIGKGVKIHETKKHTFITVFIAVICILLGLQNISSLESKLAIVTGVLLIGVAIYMLITPMIILGDDSMLFKSGNAVRKELPYSDIESWSLREDKHIIFQLKSSEEEKKKNTITLNYCNLDKSNQERFINQLNIKGVQRIMIVEPEKKQEKKKKEKK